MIIKHKEFPNFKRYEMDYCGRPFFMEVGKMAELCNAAVLVGYGDTRVLVTVTASARPKDGIDYFPLAVDFNEKLYAVGRIPGSFNRREGRPSLNAVLASRLIDRPMRPLFPSDLRNDVVIACEVMAVDRDCSPEITAMIGAAAAVSISDIPFNGPIAGIVLGWDGEKYLFNPTAAEKATNRMTTTIAASHKKIIMIESEADQVPDDVMYEGIVQAHEQIQPMLDLIDRMVIVPFHIAIDMHRHNIDIRQRIPDRIVAVFERNADGPIVDLLDPTNGVHRSMPVRILRGPAVDKVVFHARKKVCASDALDQPVLLGVAFIKGVHLLEEVVRRRELIQQGNTSCAPGIPIPWTGSSSKKPAWPMWTPLLPMYRSPASPARPEDTLT